MTLHCLYHDNCNDGYTAAWIVDKYYRGSAAQINFIPVSYGDPPPPLPPLSRVLILDFSYKRPELEQMIARTSSLLILDHHKTAEQELAFMTPPQMLSIREPRAMTSHHAIFDMARSGAQMTWDYFFGNKRPRLVDYVGDHDLWKFELPCSKAINAYLHALDRDYDTWSEAEHRLKDWSGVVAYAEKGEALLVYQHKQARAVAKYAMPFRIGNFTVPVCNAPPHMASELGNFLSLEKPFAGTYYDSIRGRHFSLRSQPYGLDVSVIAKQYGGGGHVHAAGFTVPANWKGEQS
jgi:oligoribonuclease NrnB/cAMP/cGMP phosphodiesterase (DHH superfamily)